MTDRQAGQGRQRLSDRDSRRWPQLWRVKVRDLVTGLTVGKADSDRPWLALCALDASRRYEHTILWSVTDTHGVP